MVGASQCISKIMRMRACCLLCYLRRKKVVLPKIDDMAFPNHGERKKG